MNMYTARNHKTIRLIKISGNDADDFLQQNITNDTKYDNFYALILNPVGKYNFDFFVSKYDDCFFIELPFQDIKKFILHLNYKKLRWQVNIEDISHLYHLQYSRHVLSEAIIAYQDPRFNKLGYRNIIKTQGSYDENIKSYLYDKYQFGIPDALDFEVNKSFPLEFGVDKLHGFSFSKGCYTGQEVISRTRTQGEIRKRIFKIESDSNIEDLVGQSIIKGNKKIATITSAMNNKAICLVRSGTIAMHQILDFHGYKLSINETIWNTQ